MSPSYYVLLFFPSLPYSCTSRVRFHFYFIFAALDLLTEMKKAEDFALWTVQFLVVFLHFGDQRGLFVGVNCQFMEDSASKSGDGHLVCPLQIRRCSVARQTSFNLRIEPLR